MIFQFFVWSFQMGTALQNGHWRAAKPQLPEPWLGGGEPQGTYTLNGNAGVVCGEDGIVQEVFDSKRSHSNGIRRGHRIISVGFDPFTKEGLRRAENSGYDYYVTVSCSNLMATQELLAGRHRLDTDEYSGSPTGWVKARDKGYPAYYQIHIPKTAGTSFTKDLKKILPSGAGLYAKEGCYHPMRAHLSLRDGLITMLRHPVAHVFSQYLMCAYSCWGQENSRNDRSKFKNLDTWLDYFNGASFDDEKDNGLGCYHPLNMQTRALTCHEQRVNGVHTDLRPIGNVSEAVRNMNGLLFVGIAEFYQESLCLFIAKVHNSMPNFCNCEDPDNWNVFEATHDGHKLPSHSLLDLSASQKASILRLVGDDLELYRKGLQQFADEAKRIEQQFKVKVVCQDIQETAKMTQRELDEALVIAANLKGERDIARQQERHDTAKRLHRELNEALIITQSVVQKRTHNRALELANGR